MWLTTVCEPRRDGRAGDACVGVSASRRNAEREVVGTTLPPGATDQRRRRGRMCGGLSPSAGRSAQRTRGASLPSVPRSSSSMRKANSSSAMHVGSRRPSRRSTLRR